jgi:hypothetical protein
MDITSSLDSTRAEGCGRKALGLMWTNLAEHVDTEDFSLVPEQRVHGSAVIEAPELEGAVEGGAAQLVGAAAEGQA